LQAPVPDLGPIARKTADRQSNRSTLAQDKLPRCIGIGGGHVGRRWTFSNLPDAYCIIRSDDGSRGLLAHFVPVGGYDGPRQREPRATWVAAEIDDGGPEARAAPRMTSFQVRFFSMGFVARERIDLSEPARRRTAGFDDRGHSSPR
jgi:hypothetical protein